MGKEETAIETMILDYLNLMPDMFAWKNKTAGIYDPTRKTFRTDNNKHSHNGVPDILGVCNGRFIAVEVKTQRGVVSKAQDKFIQSLTDHGGYVLIARSLGDVRAWFKKHKDSFYETKKVSEGLQGQDQGSVKKRTSKDRSNITNGRRKNSNLRKPD